MAPRILITGGSGRLGTAIRRVVDCLAPTHAEMSVLDYRSCAVAIRKAEPDIVIHCAGYVNAAQAETEREQCWALNVEGTRNMLAATRSIRARFVYISTDYVFDGEQGNYSETDQPNPKNFYGVTKLVAETLVTANAPYDNALILRAPFRADPPWRFERAFINQWTSCDFASVRAPQIVRAALMTDVTGILHIGGRTRTVYDLARLATPDVGRMTLAECRTVRLPYDTSLDSSRWHALSGEQEAAA